MAGTIIAGQTGRASDFILAADADSDETVDEGRVPKLEDTDRLSERFMPHRWFPEQAGAGIVAGNPLWLRSDGEVVKSPTIAGWVNDSSTLLPNPNAAAMDNVISVWLRSNIVLTFWSGSGGGAMAIGTVEKSGNVNYWRVVTLANLTSQQIRDVKKLNDNQVLLLRSNGASSASIQVIQVANDLTVTLGTEYSGISNASSATSIDRHSDNRFLFMYRNDTTQDATVIMMQVSGTTISTAGTSAVILSSNQSTTASILSLSSTRAVALWGDEDDDDMTGRVITISGDTLTLATNSYDFHTVNNEWLKATVMGDGDRFLVIYADNSSSGDRKMIIGELSGAGTDELTFGTALTMPSSINDTSNLLVFSPNKILLAERSGSSSSGLWYITASGNALTEVLEIEGANFYAGRTIPTVAAGSSICLAMGHIIIPVLAVGATAPAEILSVRPLWNEIFMGVAQDASNDNDLVWGIRNGFSGAHFSGLTFGRFYCYLLDGTLSEQGIYPAGQAIAADELLVGA